MSARQLCGCGCGCSEPADHIGDFIPKCDHCHAGHPAAQQAIVALQREATRLGLVRADQAGEIEQPLDEHALVSAFDQMRHVERLPEPTNERQRKAVGESIARYLCGGRDGESADVAVLRVVAGLGVAESIAAADRLAKWALALAAAADAAERRGLK